MSSKYMKSENKMLDPLKHIKKVEPNSDLFSKIENRIREEKRNKVSSSKLMAASVILIVLLASNAFVIKKTLKSNNSTADLTETFNINVSNQLYNE
ncbi:MAG: hypothetical protein P1U41_00755 [Vicingaceae bacterium]|nr:hypothetical protein [Vicingaceae bacterium]